MQRHMDGHMQACSDIDELLQLWRQEQAGGEAVTYETYNIHTFQMSAQLTRLYNRCCRYLDHENLEMSVQLLPLCSHCGDPFATDLPIHSDVNREFFLCNVCYMQAVPEEDDTPELVTEDDLPKPKNGNANATETELHTNLMIRWQTEEARGEQIILEFPQGPMPIQCFKISQELALLYKQCLQHNVPNLPQCLACRAASSKFVRGVPVHSGFNNGLQLCLCNECYCQMVGEEPDEYMTDGRPDQLAKRVRQSDGGSGETKSNDVTSDEIDKVLKLGQLFGWTVNHQKTTLLSKHDVGNNNKDLNQLVDCTNPPNVTKICQSIGEDYCRQEVNVSVVMVSPPIMFVKNEIVRMSKIASMFAEPSDCYLREFNKKVEQAKKNSKNTRAVAERRCEACRINTPKATYSGNQWKKGEGRSKCKYCIKLGK